LPELVTVLRLTGFLLTFLIDNPGLYTSALAAATATTQATRGEHDGSEAVSQEAPPPPQGKKAGGQQANAAMLWSARATQHLATFGLAANLQYNVEFLMNVVLYFCITAVKRLRDVKLVVVFDCSRSLPPAQLHGESAALPKLAHVLLLQHASLPVRGAVDGTDERAD
uniref:Rad21_Rec8 domain-containing protein n=1 Tax=Mesocestoides corti TaxID=53468 RepID=A0A5K3G240_MESCO